MTAPLLEARDLHTFYGASHVLHGVSLAVGNGETVTLMGRNGMGKTTTIRSVLGLTTARSGQVLVRGRPVSGWPAHRISRLGIALVPEGRGIFPTLTVREHLVMAARPGRWTQEGALDLFPRLRERLGHLGSQLSGGEQQMLAIARQQIWAALRRLRSEGTAALIIDKEVRQLLELGDRHLILVKGRVAFSGTTAEFRQRAEQNLALLRA